MSNPTTARIDVRKIDGKEVRVLVTETVLPAEAPLSKSRKSYLLASSSGPCGLKMAGGIPVDLTLNAYFENREYFPTDEELREAEAARRAKRAARKMTA